VFNNTYLKNDRKNLCEYKANFLIKDNCRYNLNIAVYLNILFGIFDLWIKAYEFYKHLIHLVQVHLHLSVYTMA